MLRYPYTKEKFNERYREYEEVDHDLPDEFIEALCLFYNSAYEEGVAAGYKLGYREAKEEEGEV